MEEAEAGRAADALPVDSDLEVDSGSAGAPRPVHLRWPYVGLVFAGGSVGTFARYSVSLAVPDWNGLPVGTFLINVSGAFILGVLLEVLSRGGPDHGRRRALRLLFGTGVLGGFTTYSAFAVDADGLIVAHQPIATLLYALATIVIGAGFSLAGIALGAFAHRVRSRVRRVPSPRGGDT